MPEGDTLSIKMTAKGKPPRLPFLDMKNAVLGKGYNLSLVFVGDVISRRLNKERRNKDKPTNVLSFPLTSSEGEIFINLRKARAEAPDFDMPYVQFVGFLFIHGLLHLKGMDHGSRMESEERKFRRKFKI